MSVVVMHNFLDLPFDILSDIYKFVRGEGRAFKLTGTTEKERTCNIFLASPALLKQPNYLQVSELLRSFLSAEWHLGVTKHR